MFGNFSEQMKKSAQPAASLFEMNAKTLALMSKQNSVLFSGMVGDSVKLLSAMSGQTELNGFIAAQSVYAESVRERLTIASKTTFSELNDLRTEMTNLVKSGVESASEETKAAFANAQSAIAQPVLQTTTAQAPADKTPVKKAAPIKAAVSKTVTKETVAAKPAAKKAATTKSVAKTQQKTTTKAPVIEKSLVAKNTPTKVAPKQIAKVAPTAVKTESQVVASAAKAAKAVPAAKSVAKLSPADVKAAGKK